uniref:Uncharacterized protein n=1 Tax=Tanacetum cinerariifolium TaxID=118510 RepID=A0A6L2MPG5_TANCI|nr:hypothetical protein [Tanacetum cinerariifolium]
MIDTEAEAKAIHIILTEIDNDIYSIVDACANVKGMWIAIECLMQGENINKQDVETNVGKEKEISRAPSSPPEYEEDTLRDKKIDRLMALISTYFKRIYKPTNNNLRTSSNTRNKNVEFTPRTGYERQTRVWAYNKRMQIKKEGQGIFLPQIEDVVMQTRGSSGLVKYRNARLGSRFR